MNQGGFTPLLYAAREGCVDCAQHLIAAGADPDLEDPERITPLVMALMNLHFEVAAALINGGADVDKWDFFGRSPLYMAADVSTLPIKGNGAMAVLPSEDSVTALDVAKLLLEKGANPNLQLKRRPPYRDVPQDRGGDTILAQGATPLLRAARAGDAPFVELLLEEQGAGGPAEQGRRDAADGGGRRGVRRPRDARPQPHRRGRAGDDAAAARRGRRHQRADGDRAAERGARGHVAGGVLRHHPARASEPGADAPTRCRTRRRCTAPRSAATRRS